MKEYVPMMVRNSLDSVYGSMSELGQKLFRSMAIQYLNKKENNKMLGLLKVQPDEPLFAYASASEAHAQNITVEQLLFSIFC